MKRQWFEIIEDNIQIYFLMHGNDHFFLVPEAPLNHLNKASINLIITSKSLHGNGSRILSSKVNRAYQYVFFISQLSKHALKFKVNSASTVMSKLLNARCSLVFKNPASEKCRNMKERLNALQSIRISIKVSNSPHFCIEFVFLC